VDNPVCGSHGNTNAACVGQSISPLSQIPSQSQNSAIKKPGNCNVSTKSLIHIFSNAFKDYFIDWLIIDVK
jgi:hypothetical protein